MKNLGALKKVAVDTVHPARMTVIDPDSQMPLRDGDGNECYIDFLSIDSEVGRKLDRERGFAAMRKLRSGRNAVDEDEDPTEMQVETLVALTVDWGFGSDADKFTKVAARELYANPDFGWLRRQAYVFVQTTANFIKGSSKTSSASPSTSSTKPAG